MYYKMDQSRTNGCYVRDSSSSGTATEEQIFSREHSSTNKQRSRFSVNSESFDVQRKCLPDTKAGGDTQMTPRNNSQETEEGESTPLDETLFISQGSPSKVDRASEREKTNESHKDDSESALVTLRRLSVGLMKKNERLRYTEKKFFRLLKFLEIQITHSSEKVRYLALEVLCITVPRLKAKTDSLLKPLLPKVIQCLRGNEETDIQLKALHFLRGFFRHSKCLTDFVQSFVATGLNNKDPQIRISCFHGLNIIFDQDIGNDLFSYLVVALGNQLHKNKAVIIRPAYRTLKHIHNTIGDIRFSILLNLVEPKAVYLYRTLYSYEESDSFLSLKGNDCSALLTAYIEKRRELNFTTDFGVFDTNLIDEIERTRNCERAKAIDLLAAALKETSGFDSTLSAFHLVDFLKLTVGFITDANRLIQMSGYDILKEVIKKMGFIVSPHIRSIIKPLRESLVSTNSKIQSKAGKVLHKLMLHTHPMTVVWELLNTQRSSHKEAVLILIQKTIWYFPYHELDMVPLCNFLSRSLEDIHYNVSKQSRACVRQILGILHDCPTFGSWSEAVKIILRNYKFRQDTLKDIGVYEFKMKNYAENFEFFSDDDTPDLSIEDSFLENSESSLTVEEGSPDDPPACSRCSTVNTFEAESGADCKFSKELVNDTPGSLNKCSKTISCIKPKTLSDFNIRRYPSSVNTPTLNRYSTKKAVSSHYTCETATEKQIFSREHSSTNKQRSRFSLKSESFDVQRKCLPDTKAGGDTQITPGNNFQETEDEESTPLDERPFISQSYEQDGIQVDVLSKDIFNFNILKIEHKEAADGIEEIDDKSCQECKRADSDISLNKKKFNSPKHAQTSKISGYFQEPVILTTDNSTPMNSNSNLITMEQFTNIVPCTSHVDADASISDAPTTPCTPYVISSEATLAYESAPFTAVDDIYSYTPFSNIVPSSDVLSAVSSTSIANSTIQNPINNKAFSNDIPNTSSDVSLTNRVSVEQVESQATQPLKQDLETKFYNQNNASVRTSENSRKTTKVSRLLKSNVNENNGNSDNRTELSLKYKSSENVIDNETRERRKTTHCVQGKVERRLLEKNSASYCNELFETETPFVPKSRQLPRTPVVKKSNILQVQLKDTKNKIQKLLTRPNKRNKTGQLKICEKVTGNLENVSEGSEKLPEVPRDTNSSLKLDEKDDSMRESLISSKHNSPSTWEGCQWRRDLDYVARAGTCAWADQFEELMKSIGPYPSLEDAENEFNKAISDLNDNDWTKKEEAMVTVIRLVNHHSLLMYGNTAKIIVPLSNEIKNYRQSVAGKAILTVGHVYEMMGKHFESKLRMVIGALLGKTGTRTLAAYHRLVIRSLTKITKATSPQKAIMAFIQEGSKQIHKSARDTAAQFICLLAESLGPENCLTPSLSGSILKCAGMFVFDSSALTRYCGKRIFDTLRKHPDFEKLKDHHLDINTTQNLNKILEQMKKKGIGNEILPISLID